MRAVKLTKVRLSTRGKRPDDGDTERAPEPASFALQAQERSLRSHVPDVICMPETKFIDANFLQPHQA